MAKISRIDWENYLRKLRLINEAAAEELKQWVEQWGRDASGAMLLDLMDAVDAWDQNIVDAAYAITQKYGDASAATAAAMYDATAEFQGKIVPPAELADNPPYWEVRKTIQGTLKTSSNLDELAGAVSRLVKRTGVDTTMKNAIRDGAEWAWIPNGDTCAFCLTLASRGWQKASKKALKNGHAEHIHSNCDCTYATRLSDDVDVSGYDPDKYLKMYYDADGVKPKDRINAMRREAYAKNKDKINAQKREAYDIRERKKKANEKNFITEDGRPTIKQNDIIKPRNIINDLNKTRAGKTALKRIEDNDTKVMIRYGVENENNLLGYYDHFDNQIIIFGDETKTVHETASIVVHEANHIKGNGASQRQEIACMIQEELHRKGLDSLTKQEVNDIIKFVKETYDQLPW